MSMKQMLVAVPALVLGLVLGPVLGMAASATDRATVAAASDLQFALAEIVAAFEAETGHTFTLVFGSSGNLYRQVQQGAPFELFLSADEAFVHGLVESRHARDAGALYAIGRLVLFARTGSPVDPRGGLGGLSAALADGRLTRFAIANPEHAPYGRAAEQALRQAGLWEAIEPTLVRGENVSQAAQFVASGAAEAGLIAYSLALAPALAAQGDWSLIEAAAHAPLRQRMVLTHRAGPAATALYEHLRGPAARETLARYGFVLPEVDP
jgi:molybdate transport system substrate-binding protein